MAGQKKKSGTSFAKVGGKVKNKSTTSSQTPTPTSTPTPTPIPIPAPTTRNAKVTPLINPSINLVINTIPPTPTTAEAKNPWYEIRSSGEGRGLGVFASKYIPRGTRILSEVPQLVVDLSAFTRAEIRAGLETGYPSEPLPVVELSLGGGGGEGGAAGDAAKVAETTTTALTAITQDVKDHLEVSRAEEVRKTIMEAFRKIPDAEQRLALSLHCDNPTGQRQDIISILKSNGFDHGVNGAALCISSSRFNHSCVPNAHFGWNAEIDQQTFQIIKEGGLSAGEEILVCYGEVEAVFESRQRHLKATYGFECFCAVCVVGSRRHDVSERRRIEIGSLLGRIAEFEKLPYEVGLVYGVKDPLGWILRIRDLLIEEGLIGLCLARILRKAGVCYRAAGKMRKAVETAAEELKVIRYCLGPDHSRIKEVGEWTKGLK